MLKKNTQIWYYIFFYVYSLSRGVSIAAKPAPKRHLIDDLYCLFVFTNTKYSLTPIEIINDLAFHKKKNKYIYIFI